MVRLQTTQRRERGFTLLEIAIVLVILGLLTGGVIAGRELIRASELQMLVTQINQYQNAVKLFRTKFLSSPGDMPNATSYWGTNPNCATGGAGTGTQTCNGNGNGKTDISCCSSMEQFLFWQHLQNAGMIPGNYSGGGASSSQCWPGPSPAQNCPTGILGQLYFSGYANTDGTGGWWQLTGNVLIIGRSGAYGYPGWPLLSATEAYSLDTKVDDGIPGTGHWMAFMYGGGYIPNCVVNASTKLALADGTTASEPLSAYNLSYGTAPACSLRIKDLGF